MYFFVNYEIGRDSMDNLAKDLDNLYKEVLLIPARANKDIMQFIANVLKDNKPKAFDPFNENSDTKQIKKRKGFNPFNE